MPQYQYGGGGMLTAGSPIPGGFSVGILFSLIGSAVKSVQTKLQFVANNRSTISIGDMFEMQMLMNHLAQLSDMAGNIVAATNQVISGMARNVKG